MKILAIDTALQAASACVYDDAADLYESVESLPMERGHAEALLPLIDRVMARVEGGFPALSRVAVSVGPGSFTGLRVGLAAARAIGLACEIPVVGVSTLAALAAPLIMERRPEIVAVAIDARHGQIYFSGFEPGGRALSTPRVARLSDAAAELATADAALRRHGLGLSAETGEPEPLARLVGSGAELLAVELERRGAPANVAPGALAPDVRFIARLGLLADPELSPPRPLYLKPADAKPQRVSPQQTPAQQVPPQQAAPRRDEPAPSQPPQQETAPDDAGRDDTIQDDTIQDDVAQESVAQKNEPQESAAPNAAP